MVTPRLGDEARSLGCAQQIFVSRHWERGQGSTYGLNHHAIRGLAWAVMKPCVADTAARRAALEDHAARPPIDEVCYGALPKIMHRLCMVMGSV